MTSPTADSRRPVTVCWHIAHDGTDASAAERRRLKRLLARLHRDDRRLLLDRLSETPSSLPLVLDLRYEIPQADPEAETGWRWGWVRLTVLSHDNDVGRQFNALVIDITDLKETEKQLQDRQTALNTSLIELQKTKGKLEVQSAVLINTAGQLETARIAAEEANRVKSEFLSNMSHELRTPLNAIIGFSQIIKQQTFGPVGSTKYRDYATDIHDSGCHLLELINEVLDFSMMEAGAAELLEDDVDVTATIRTVLRMVADRAEKQGISLSVDTPDDLPLLRADTRKMRQILINLLTNAIKFTGEGGTITITIWARSSSGFVLQVTDTGIGIALEDIPKALGVFGQVDSAMTRQHQGTGLGLPLTKSLAELHGGSLDLQSQPGIGTTVTIRFPAERIIENTAAVAMDLDARRAEKE